MFEFDVTTIFTVIVILAIVAVYIYYLFKDIKKLKIKALEIVTDLEKSHGEKQGELKYSQAVQLIRIHMDKYFPVFLKSIITDKWIDNLIETSVVQMKRILEEEIKEESIK